MLQFCQGNIFDSTAEVLVNPVNCVGVTGAGLARQFRRRFPVQTLLYVQAARKGSIEPGKIFPTQVIIFFPTKWHWRDQSELENIERGLQDLAAYLQTHPIRSIAIPALGCGLGGLPWHDVKEKIVGLLAGVPCHVEVFEPASAEVDVE